MPYTGGGITDLVDARVAQKMQGPLGQSIVVDTAGGDSILAPTSRPAAPDVYTMVPVIAGYAPTSPSIREAAFDPSKTGTGRAAGSRRHHDG